MLDISWVPPLLGKPWELAAEGPESFDCWGLCRFVYRDQLGLELPPAPTITSMDPGPVARAISRELMRGPFEATDEPAHLDLVAMSNARAFHHVGVWLDIDGGLVLHARDRANVCLQSKASLKAAQINRIAFYKFTP